MTRTNRMRDGTGLGMEIGLLAGLVLVNVLFQLVPGTELGRLSTKTLDNTMDAVDAFLPYDSSVDEIEKEVIEEKVVIDQQVEEFIQEVTISLTSDTVGLSSVQTIENFTDDTGAFVEEIGPPGFMPAEVLPFCSYMPPPDYPEIARLAGVEGVVTLWVYIDSEGVLQDVQLFHSSGVSSLDEAAISAARNTRWNSARNNGSPTGVWTTMTYNFSLSD